MIRATPQDWCAELRRACKLHARDALPDRVLAGICRTVHDAISARRCLVVQEGFYGWESGNSFVASTPIVDLSRALGVDNSHQVAMNLVHISGPTSEDLHFHNSHVLAFALAGRGQLQWRPDPAGPSRFEEVSTGAIVVIPQDVSHIFSTDPGGSVVYIALEFSDRHIDYQKHFYQDPKFS